MKILACVSEKYIEKDNEYYASPTSVSFIQEAFPEDDILVVSQLIKGSSQDFDNYGSKVSSGNFFELPYFSSIKDFSLKCITNFSFYKNFKSICFDILYRSDCDVVWLRNPSIGSLVFGLCAIKKNKPIINHMCANAMLGWKNEKYSYIEKVMGWIFSHILTLMVKRISSYPKSINICTGDVLENICLNYSSRTYQFVDLMISPPLLTSVADRCQNFLFIGRLQEDKGIYELCAAFNEIPQCTLTVVGYGPSYEEIFERYNLKPNINIIGQVKHSELGAVIESSDCVVVPSKNNYEGFPRVIMESWSYGKPVIVSNAGGVKAFVEDQVNGLLMKDVNINTIKDSINKLYSDDGLYHSLVSGTKAMKTVSDKAYWLKRIQEIIKSG